MTAPLLGTANLITATRALLVAVVAGAAVVPITPSAAGLAVAIGSVAALLDLADGWVARRTGSTSAFGARFDMEVDALLILVLAGLVWRYGVTGPWVLASGLMRYAFVALARVWPWLARPLPPSRRRQAACVVQIVALLVALAPVTPAPLGLAAAAIGLGALTWSFAVDVAWLALAAGRDGR
jgi:phosphatidylglycerophosphate synthase